MWRWHDGCIKVMDRLSVSAIETDNPKHLGTQTQEFIVVQASVALAASNGMERSFEGHQHSDLAFAPDFLKPLIQKGK